MPFWYATVISPTQYGRVVVSPDRMSTSCGPRRAWRMTCQREQRARSERRGRVAHGCGCRGRVAP
eukprot:5950568-Prymnesium_polylepis.2